MPLTPADVVLGAEALFLALLGKQVHWNLVSLDDGTQIEGQFHAQDLTENVSSTWATASTLGFGQPILQFITEDIDTISFTAKVFAKHEGLLGTGLLADDVQPMIELITGLPKVDPELGRPQIYVFGVGKYVRTVVVTSVGGIKHDRFRGRDGSHRGAIFQISLTRYEPYDISSLAQAESLVTPARTGETYESIARRELGDPLLGEALRRRNPDRLVLQEGDLVHVPRAAILRKEVFPLTPQSLFLKNGTAQRQNKIDAFIERGGETPTHVLLTNWGD